MRGREHPDARSRRRATLAEVALEHMAALHADQDPDRAAVCQARLQIRLSSERPPADRPTRRTSDRFDRSATRRWPRRLDSVSPAARAIGNASAKASRAGRATPWRPSGPTTLKPARLQPRQVDVAAASAAHERIAKQGTAHDEVDDGAPPVCSAVARAEAGSGPGGPFD